MPLVALADFVETELQYELGSSLSQQELYERYCFVCDALERTPMAKRNFAPAFLTMCHKKGWSDVQKKGKNFLNVGFSNRPAPF